MKHIIATICTIVLAAVLVVPAVLLSGGQSGVSASKLVANDIAQSGTNGATITEESINEEQSDEPFGGADYEPGVALVSFSDEVDDYETALAQLSEETGIQGLAIEKVGLGYVEVSIPGEVATDDAIARISTAQVIDDVQPNYVYYLAEDESSSASITPIASLDLQSGQIDLNEQAAINDYDGQSSDRYWHLTKIQAFDAWDQVKTYPSASKDAAGVVTVAVLDNCFNVNHEDLVGNIVAAKSVTNAAIGDTSNVGTPYHGTHVAGIVAAQANNGKGAAGVSYNARIMPVRVSNSNGGISTSYLIDAYDYVLANASAYNVRVINVSIGGPRSNLSWSTIDRQLFSRIDNAYRAGIVTVVAANNASSGNDLSKQAPFYAFPADYPTCVTVINTDENDKRFSRTYNNVADGDGSSNYNVTNGSSMQTTKDISAPGTRIYSSKVATNSTYDVSTGTSMAAPVVSGVLALMFAYADENNQTLTADDAVSRLHSTAVDIGEDGFDAETGYGRVDAYAAVTSSTSLSGGANTIKVGGTTTLSLGVSAAWSSSDTSIATVDNSGKVTGIAPGSTVISARFTLGFRAYTASQTVTVYDPSILKEGSKISNLNLTYGNTAQLAITDDQPVGNWVWSTSDPSVVSVGAGTGAVVAKKPGTATITVTLSNNSAVSASVKVTVSAIDISRATITLSTNSYTYDGTAKKPSVSSVKLGSTTLKSGTDYKVSSYASNTNAGVATVTIIGLGNYAGSVSKAFTINKASISSVSLSPTSYTYDGKVKNPTLTVKGSNGKTLTSSDYTVITPSGRTAVGTYTYSVTGKGNYKGTKTASFRIGTSPSWSGATKIPVGATADYSVSNGSIDIKQGSQYATLSGKRLTGVKAGTVVLALKDASGNEYTTKSVEVYALDGTWELQSAMNSSMVLDINGAGIANGANMIIWPRNGGANQRFRFVATGSGYYSLEMTHSGKRIDVHNASKDRGHQVIQWPANGGANQQWALSVDASNNITLTSRHSGLVIDVDGAKAVSGRQVIQWSSNGGNNQKWTLVKHSNSAAAAERGYRLRAGSTSFAIDIAGASQSAGANACLWLVNNGANQRIQLIDCGSGYVRLSAYHSGQVLDVAGGRAYSNANVLQWLWAGSANQKWRMLDNKDGTYSFLSVAGQGYALTWSGSARAGSNIQLAVWTGASNQRFKLEGL